MATNNDKLGLLNKMVKLIRGQPENMSHSVLTNQEQDSESSKAALKERIARKRQDDSVRQREFNHLRTLRKTSPLFTGHAGARSSTFQNSAGFDRKERALTVKKIDDIEATMSKHWVERKLTAGAESKEENPTTEGPLRSEAIHMPIVMELASSPVVPPVVAAKQTQRDTLPASAQVKVHEALPMLSASLDAFELASFDEYDFAKMAAPQEAVPPASAKLEAKPTEAVKPLPTPVKSSSSITKPEFNNFERSGWNADISVFAKPNFWSDEMGAGMASANLREAAIYFAEGDSVAAQEILMNAMKAEKVEAEMVHGYSLALLDLYCVTGQRTLFEAAAIDFAERFGKSAPEWFFIPESLGSNSASLSTKEASTHSVIGRQIVWECPATLDMSAMKALRASLVLNDLPKHLNWGGLKKIESDAAKELAALFANWSVQEIKLYFGSVQVLIAVLKSYTLPSDVRVDPMWWHLRLDNLRILGLRDDFESVALDFCVVYEISPPSWKNVACVCIHELAVSDAPNLVLDPLYETSVIGTDPNDAALLELSGEILGDAVPVLEQLRKECAGVETVVISCANLIRVDFVAAGAILNWVAERQANGVHVEFSDMPLLVAAFFRVIGIDEHAAVLLRMR